MHEYKILESGAPLQEAEKAIIVLHGRGGSAEDIMGLAKQFADEKTYIAAPNATNNTWYPYGFMAPDDSNQPWLESAVNYVKKLLDSIKEHLKDDQIYIMGFSQGACLSLEVASRFASHYAGVASFTGGLIGQEIDIAKYSGDFKGTNVFIGNSDIDPHVPESRSEDSKKVMTDLGADVMLKIYQNMPHTIIEDEINTVKELMF